MASERQRKAVDRAIRAALEKELAEYWVDWEKSPSGVVEAGVGDGRQRRVMSSSSRGDGSPRAAIDASLAPGGDALCPWCRAAPASTRGVWCSKKCRQSAWRARRLAVSEDLNDTPKRLAYADPPYPGTSLKYYGDQPDYAGEVDHAELVSRLQGYDGWALSTSVRALRESPPAVVGLCPAESRSGSVCGCFSSSERRPSTSSTICSLGQESCPRASTNSAERRCRRRATVADSRSRRTQKTAPLPKERGG